MRFVGMHDLHARSAYQPTIHKQGDRWIAYIGHDGGREAVPNPVRGGGAGRDRSGFLEFARKPQPFLFRGGERFFQLAALSRKLRRFLRLADEGVRLAERRIDACHQISELTDLLFQRRDAFAHRRRRTLVLLNEIRALTWRS